MSTKLLNSKNNGQNNVPNRNAAHAMVEPPASSQQLGALTDIIQIDTADVGRSILQPLAQPTLEEPKG